MEAHKVLGLGIEVCAANRVPNGEDNVEDLENGFKLVAGFGNEESVTVDQCINKQVNKEEGVDDLIGCVPCSHCFPTVDARIVLHDAITADTEAKHDADHQHVDHLVGEMIHA